MLTKLHWVNGPWPGRFALAARPRGGDWLQEEIAGWRQAGVDSVFSLLTRDEEQVLDLTGESAEVRKQRMKFSSFPIPDRQVPSSHPALVAALEKIDADLLAGKNVVIHCRQGIGRSGLVGACLLISKGVSAGAAVDNISAARGLSIPETEEQQRWIERYAAALAGAK